MPLQYLIPAFLSFILVIAIPFFNGREYRLLLKLLLGLAVGVVPIAIAAMEARNVFEFFSIWFQVLLAPVIWLSGGAEMQGAGQGAAGSWMPFLLIAVILVVVLILWQFHSRAKRRGP